MSIEDLDLGALQREIVLAHLLSIFRGGPPSDRLISYVTVLRASDLQVEELSSELEHLSMLLQPIDSEKKCRQRKEG